MKTYSINDIYPTIQGEGVNTGIPMTLVRMQGCAVGCVFCDTKETWKKDPRLEVESLEEVLDSPHTFATVSAGTIVDFVADLSCPGINWALLTGGEPAEQPLAELIDAFHRLDYRVALETSGTATGHVAAGIDWVCLSPKVGQAGGLELDEQAVREADEITWVVGKDDDLRALTAFLTKYQLPATTQICLQPMSQGKKATALCVDQCLHTGWRLSLQTHKYINLR